MAKDKAATAEVVGTPFERAKAAFEDSEHELRYSERIDVCPQGDGPMTIRKEFKDPEQFHMTGKCATNPEHDIERFGFFSTEGSE